VARKELDFQVMAKPELRFARFWLVWFLGAVAVARPGLAAVDSWKVGVAKVNITPDQSMWMGGYASRERPAEGKQTDLWAKALVLEDNSGQRAVLVTLDLLGIDRGLSRAICGQLNELHGIQRQQVALCTSHTHSGPVVASNLRAMHYLALDPVQQSLVDQYAESLARKVVAVVGEALDGLTDAQLSWGQGVAGFAVNRRENPEADVVKLRAEGKLKGPVDHSVPVLAARRRDGMLIAAAFGYACHATVLNGFHWSGDYPAYAQMAIEAAHPTCQAMFWAGCGGDQNPLPRRRVDLAEAYGRELAAAVQAVLEKEMTPIGGNLSCRYHELDLPLAQLPSKDDLARDAAANDKYIAARAKMLLANLDQGQSLSQTYPYPIAIWHFGDQVRMVFLGGEVVVDYALRLKTELDANPLWVAAYSNDVMAYIPSRRVLLEGGYEGATSMIYYGLPTVWAPELEEAIIREVKENVSHAHRN
jgi:hypothetical protein